MADHAVSMLIEKTSRGKASLNRITELLDAKVDVKDRGGVQDLPSIHGKIEFRNLTFRYPDGEYDVLKNVSFTIEPGESVGIVGKTGSGKTTIVDLLLRTYNVPDGTLFIDDHDVNTVPSTLCVRAVPTCRRTTSCSPTRFPAIFPSPLMTKTRRPLRMQR